MLGQVVRTHKPALRHFAIENIDGKVEGVEARCDSDRLIAPVNSQQAWSMPNAWGDGEVFDFGEDEATLASEKSPADREDTMLGADAIARSNALD